MSTARVIEELKKIRGKLPKSGLSTVDYPLDVIISLLSQNSVPLDHKFIPEVDVVDTTQTVIDINGIVIAIAVTPDSGPVKVNFDRAITPTEYTIVNPASVKVYNRLTKKIYLQALQGYTAKVRIEALTGGV